MQHRTHKRFIREMPMTMALLVAQRLAAATVDFVLETKPATRGRQAYLSCHFEETLNQAIDQAASGQESTTQGCRLSVALDAEIVGACHMPQGHPTHCGCLTR